MKKTFWIFRKFRPSQLATAIILLAISLCAISPRGQTGQGEPLPSWNDTDARRGIIDFVTRVTREGGPDFVPAADRIATFDNDGTLWVEKPAPAEVYFIFERVRELTARFPSLKERPPFKAALE